ncbi:MAG: hypothetical protein EOO43_16700 [Flavobacterium sp.]|nr:MAG: hypothetical protein EOO43_16700 [Flavobacterium sp.]
MKKRFLGVAFGAALIAFCSFSVDQAMAQQSNKLTKLDPTGPTITCPSGDLYVCYTIYGAGNVMKGRGDTIVTQ